jgi:hypothetical protein
MRFMRRAGGIETVKKSCIIQYKIWKPQTEHVARIGMQEILRRNILKCRYLEDREADGISGRMLVK